MKPYTKKRILIGAAIGLGIGLLNSLREGGGLRDLLDGSAVYESQFPLEEMRRKLPIRINDYQTVIAYNVEAGKLVCDYSIDFQGAKKLLEQTNGRIYSDSEYLEILKPFSLESAKSNYYSTPMMARFRSKKISIKYQYYDLTNKLLFTHVIP